MNDPIILELTKQIANLQRQVDGLIKPEVGRWVSFTPALYQNNVAVTNTLLVGQYLIGVDKSVTVMGAVNATGAGTVGTVIDIELPAILLPSTTATGIPIGIFHAYDSGTAWYSGIAIYRTSVAGLPRISGLAHNNGGNYIGGIPSYALANNDTVGVLLSYRLP